MSWMISFLLIKFEYSCQLAPGNVLRLCGLVYVPLKVSKTVPLCTILQFWGLKLDSVKQLVILPSANGETLLGDLSLNQAGAYP